MNEERNKARSASAKDGSVRKVVSGRDVGVGGRHHLDEQLVSNTCKWLARARDGYFELLTSGYGLKMKEMIEEDASRETPGDEVSNE